jgi:pimeloyl-ACP methyl ester carboxylesterase
MRSGEITAGGLRFSVAEAGGPARRRILLVHGFTGAKEDFTEWLDPLADLGWHAAAADHRGHGASDKPAGLESYSLELLAGDVIGVVDALGWDRFVLLGHSMGGMASQLVALDQTERLDGLVLMDTCHGPIETTERHLVDVACAIVADGGMEALARVMAERQGPLSSPAHQRLLAERPEHGEFNERKLRATLPDAYRALLPGLLDQADRLDRLPAIDVPALVLVGEEDAPFLGPSRRMAVALPRARLEVVPDAGHSPQFENPDAWWAALTRFLKEVE